jgi:hypothetical protein
VTILHPRDRTFLWPTADVGDRWPLKGDRWRANDEWTLVGPRRCWQLFRAWLGYDVPLPSLSSSAPAESFPRGIFTGPVNTNARAYTVYEAFDLSAMERMESG